MATFRPYTLKEIHDAAVAYGIKPTFAEAIYEVESSRGTNPQAMVARRVKRKRDSTIVRGPFQLEDDTTSDLLRENQLNVNIDDPDAHLDLAMRQMRKLQDRYRGDYVKMAQAYLGRGTDELGTTSEGYGNKIITTMRRLDAAQGGPVADVTGIATVPTGRIPADDLFGIPAMDRASPFSGPPLVQQGGPQRDPLGLPIFIGANAPQQPQPQFDMHANAEESEIDRLIRQLTDEEFEGKDFSAAA